MAWLIWIAIFFVVEGWAIFGSAPRATLSNHVRDFLRHQSWPVLTFAWVFMIWLTLHFLVDLKD